MDCYYTAQVCLNGHMINDSADKYPESNQDFCSRCGAKTITTCPSCGTRIRGYYSSEFVILGGDPTPVHAYCSGCGKPYPWTESAIRNATDIINEEDELSEQLKASMIDSLADIVSETPRTNLATVRIQKGLATAGRFTADAIRQFVIDFGCELAKKTLGF